MRWIKNGKVQEYSATDEDALVLAQAVAREGAPRAAVAWALAQRFAFLFPRYPTLAKFVRAYSQPINPRWFPDGDLHIRRMRRLEGNKDAQADEQRRALRRVEFASRAWEELPGSARQLALEAIEAEGDSPVPGAVHFRASKAPASASKRQGFERAQRFAASRADLTAVIRVPEGYGPKVNWFFESPGSTGVQLLADGDDPLIPKDDLGGFPEPPQDLPRGEGWGWAWCYSPSFSSQQASEADAQAPVESSESDEEVPQDKHDHQEGDEEGEELPPGDVVSIADARSLFPNLADAIDDSETENLDEVEGSPA